MIIRVIKTRARLPWIMKMKNLIKILVVNLKGADLFGGLYKVEQVITKYCSV
jgi:hypothetical protein